MESLLNPISYKNIEHIRKNLNNRSVLVHKCYKSSTKRANCLPQYQPKSSAVLKKKQFLATKKDPAQKKVLQSHKSHLNNPRVLKKRSKHKGIIKKNLVPVKKEINLLSKPSLPNSMSKSVKKNKAILSNSYYAESAPQGDRGDFKNSVPRTGSQCRVPKIQINMKTFSTQSEEDNERFDSGSIDISQYSGYNRPSQDKFDCTLEPTRDIKILFENRHRSLSNSLRKRSTCFKANKHAVVELDKIRTQNKCSNKLMKPNKPKTSISSKASKANLLKRKGISFRNMQPKQKRYVALKPEIIKEPSIPPQNPTPTNANKGFLTNRSQQIPSTITATRKAKDKQKTMKLRYSEFLIEKERSRKVPFRTYSLQYEPKKNQ
ncbi:unnamed protein product [Moneuplotes crassus]|uniref:Uncharacterized protein n=1 Tax=Euplotes crassus TaxID=5936 RepID=A0AAD1Y549_EUPCR|nr:unnamed protein product [Moneuplotes crassus]